MGIRRFACRRPSIVTLSDLKTWYLLSVQSGKYKEVDVAEDSEEVLLTSPTAIPYA